MDKNKSKHQLAFCVSAIVFCIGLSFVAEAIIAHSTMVLVIGGLLTILSMLQAMDSYSFLQKSEDPINKLKGGFMNALNPKEPENMLLIEKFFNLC